tara:strand:+ start:737 stop:937 length:201 start_codon:yes stop_codon:yes gene_type:complete
MPTLTDEEKRLKRNAAATAFYQKNKERLKVKRDKRMADPVNREAYNKRMNEYYHAKKLKGKKDGND